ncbi:Zinc finger BED domain-containing protein 4 [Merluccius polli]|uniref:Zinc finger BED domain-containing protein 4 n=1 Tax=Merluccius polli TaxID=89951 RepID=A0AA47M3Q3_MERPO|nr:Zinc finger BED domain-containing protein 4 [Merluccius polli]
MSVVWNYFKVSTLNSKIAVCNECKAEVSRGGARTASFNTSNLISHLSKNHPVITRHIHTTKQQKEASGDTEKIHPATQWGILEKMITLLELFEQLTKDISSAEATAADVIPGVVSLTRLLTKIDESDQGVKTAKRTLQEAVSDRFDGVQSEPLYAIATMVDARYKDRYFDIDKKERARNMLLKVVEEMSRGNDDQRGEAAGTSADDLGMEDPDQDPPPRKARHGKSNLQDMYQEILEENELPIQAATGGTASQVHKYLGEATVLKKACPFNYWRSNQTRFPVIACVARKYLTAPCTSVDSERLFSAVAHVIDEKRNRIHCDKVEMLIFIQKNLPLTHKDKMSPLYLHGEQVAFHGGHQ